MAYQNTPKKKLTATSRADAPGRNSFAGTQASRKGSSKAAARIGAVGARTGTAAIIGDGELITLLRSLLAEAGARGLDLPGDLKHAGESDRLSDSLAVTIADAARLTSISRSALYLDIAAGVLPAHHRGRSLRILRSDLEQYLRALPAAPTNSSKSPRAADAVNIRSPIRKVSARKGR